MKKIPNEYDEIKGLLNKIRKIQSTSKPNDYGVIGEQIEDNQEKEYPEPPDPEIGHDQYLKDSGQLKSFDDDTFVKDPTIKTVPGEKEQEDIAVINDVDVEIHSEDPEDFELQDEEKQKISQLIDDFRREVSEMVEFDRLHIYEDRAKLDGKIIDINLIFSLSTGEDTGLYISNPSMLKIDDNSFGIINKLKVFEQKYVNTINDLLVSRRTT